MELPIKVIVHHTKEGGYWASIPGMEGVYTQADTMEELGANIREAFEGWLEVLQEDAIAKEAPDPDDDVRMEVITL